MIVRTARKLVLCALLGVLAAGLQSELKAESGGGCPTSDSCTAACPTGRGCTWVECLDCGALGYRCVYSGCHCGGSDCLGINCGA